MALVRSAHPEPSSFPNASPSISSHDVFLSFRGEDTRKTFTDHLYTALMNAGFRTFRDDNDLQRGKNIKPELEKAIEQSRSSVIVFSKDYASSGWCLDELLMIMKRRRTADHIVLPVFYDVDPSHVRKQTGSLAKAFARHEKNQSLKGKVKRWREALTEAADLSGMVLQNEADGHESKFIKKVVKVIEDRLRRTPLSVDRHLVGIKSQVEEINLWLEDGSTDNFILLVYGMRGIGKSTIAKYVYNLNYHRFERCSFLEDIREFSKQSNGLVDLQKRLLYDILSGKKVKIQGISEGIAKIEDAVSSRRVFLVLDDVDHVDHLDALLRMQNRFYPGSKIIITTSCAGLVEAHRQFVKVHEVNTLEFDESLELFSWHAFGQSHPIESYMDLSRRIVDHCGQLPLALKVLGSSLSGKRLGFWKSYVNKLEVIPHGDILKTLKISYESLQDDHDRNLFLHIACFFIGMEKDVIVTILDDSDIFPEVGIQNLIDRCLVTIEYNKVQMHNLIRDMGREIARLESKEPRKRRRLWHHKDSIKVLTENNGTEEIEGIVVNMLLHPTYTSPSRNASKVVLETNAFTRMHNLRFLQLSHVQLNGSYEEFPAGLRWLCWTKYPLASLPNEFPLESVVALEMCYSNLRQVWRRTKYMYIPSLKVLNLSHSHDLTETPDFSSIPNLERLNLRDCVSLIDVHESIGSLERLVYWNVEDCTSIRRLPKNISFLVSLEVLIISGCSSLGEFPVDMRKMESLKEFQADGVPIHRLLVTTTREVELCSSPIQELSWASYLPRNLVNLSLRNCNLLDDDFPSDVANLLSLQNLDLSGNPISRLPDCIRGVTGLQELSFQDCTKLKSLLRLPDSLIFIMGGCTSLEKGDFKMEPIERVDKEMLKLLSLGNLETLENILMDSTSFSRWKGTHPVQGLYENGIFSTFLPGDEVPGQFSHRSRGSSVSFTVPLLPNLNIRGLNVFSVIAQSNNNDSDPLTNSVNIDGFYPAITVAINKSKGLKWIYGPQFYGVPGEGKDVIWLSHWKFGNRLTCGDKVTILIYTKSDFKVKECGIQLVYYDEKDQEKISGTQLGASTVDDLCFLRAGVRSTIPCHPRIGITFMGRLLFYEGIEDNDLIRDINEKSEKEEGQEGDLVLTFAAQSGSNSNKRGLISRGWKGIMMATILILSLPLVTRSSLFQQRKKQQSTSPP
ncbi:disease resistance protein RUN1-like isoform X2 [Rosa rugosa]|uniref:disease resistance protein RUN1-like isoform X2 n=1 Tax=Rosa rugosa TaxID=74645 RepID=UPI002B4088E6|nr:disease resistance protein RUN1-like isoform X2 [Rosa rugosa]